MLDSVRKNAEIELDRKTRAYMGRLNLNYSDAYRKVLANNPDLTRKYAFGADAVVEKRYSADTLSPAQREMANLQADAGKTQVLACWAIDRLAQTKLGNVGQGPYSAPTYKQALAEVRKEFPNLARAAADGFISDGDYQLVGMLVPSVQGEIQKGNYHQAVYCACGKNKALCRGEKLARQRGVSENAVAEFAACIREANQHGDELDKIRCFY